MQEGAKLLQRELKKKKKKEGQDVSSLRACVPLGTRQAFMATRPHINGEAAALAFILLF